MAKSKVTNFKGICKYCREQYDNVVASFRRKELHFLCPHCSYPLGTVDEFLKMMRECNVNSKS